MIKRFAFSIVLAFFSTFLCFIMISYSKGGVAFYGGSNTVSIAVKKQIERNLELDKPLLVQYQNWIKKLIQGDLGTSLVSGQKVSQLILDSFFNTLILSLSALVILFILSILLALLSLLYQDSFLDKIINMLCMSLFALPSFALGLIFIIFFGAYLQILPVSGSSDLGFEDDFFNRFLHLILPVSVLVFSHLAVFLRVARNSLIESFNQNYILNAFARGLSKKRIYFHFVLKSALNPIVSYFGASALSFMMGTYVIESVFSYGGLGELVVKSIIFKDYPVVLALILISVLMASCFSFVADMICKITHPRFKEY